MNMDLDMSAQGVWLTQQAHQLGYADVDEMFSSTPEIYLRLAESWRSTHPLSAGDAPLSGERGNWTWQSVTRRRCISSLRSAAPHGTFLRVTGVAIGHASNL